VILVGIPTHDNRVHAQLCTRLLEEAQRDDAPHFTVAFRASSLLPLACNWVWCLALGNRPEVSHFLMIHSDVIPEPGFMSKLMGIMDETGAQVISVLLPIKDLRGMASTALMSMPATPRGLEAGRRLRRLTLREAADARLPEHFDAGDLARLFEWDEARDGKPVLLANTGLMLADVRPQWAEKAYFEMVDGIRLDDAQAGRKWTPVVRSEDWQFSLLAAQAGARVVVTRRVSAQHAGMALYPNRGDWGQWNTDRDAFQPA
jgi:hypothetical protein